MRPSSSTSSLRTTSTASTRSVAEDRDRRDEEAQHDPPRLALRRARGVLAQQLDVAARALAVGLELALARRRRARGRPGSTIDVGAGELAELLQLGRRERRLHRPAAAEHHDLLDARSRRSRRSRRRSCRSARAPRRSARASARSRSRRCRSRSRPRARARGRTRGPGSRGGRCTRRRTRWPATSRAGPRPGCRAGGRSARRPRRRPRRRARAAPRARRRGRPRRCRRSGSPGCAAVFSKTRETALIFWWSGATPSRTRPQRRRQALDQVDLDRRILALQQRVGRVEAGRAGADDGDAQRALIGRCLARECAVEGCSCSVPQPEPQLRALSPSATWKL